jgi:hypothetical protein
MKQQSNNSIFCPGRLLTLWEMNQLLTERFLTAWVLFLREYEKAGQEKADPMALIDEDSRNHIVRAMESMHWESEKLGLVHSPKLCREIKVQLTDVAWHWDAPRREAFLRGQPEPRMPKELPPQTFQQVYSLLRTLGRIIQEEMTEIKLVVIKSDKVRFFEKDELFGPEVAQAFPEANVEIKDAGNCLAADLNTAAVFHLMRASELGLRALAQKLNAWQRSFPVEFAQWSEVIDEIKKELEKREAALLQTGKGPQKDAALEYFSVVLSDIKHLKLDRDRVMHTRADYDSNEAQGIFRRVNEFMNRLSKT